MLALIADWPLPLVPWEPCSLTGTGNAETGGTSLLTNLLPGRRFPYPKSLYAVEDVLRFFVADLPTATILDFFAGSGTTAHAVMRLNRQEGPIDRWGRGLQADDFDGFQDDLAAAVLMNDSDRLFSRGGLGFCYALHILTVRALECLNAV